MLARLVAFVVLTVALPFAMRGSPVPLERKDDTRRVQTVPHEVPEDPYSPQPREHRRTSPAYRYSSSGFSVVQVNVDSLGMNIVGDAANEPSIAVSPVDPDRLAIGWRQFDTISSNFRQAGYGYSKDGGLTWTFPGVLAPGVFRSDPVLGSDADGDFYYYSLAVDPNYYCVLYTDSTGGASWDGGIYAYGGDKAWMSVDKTAGIGRDNVYFAWDYAGCCGDDWFTRTTDGGLGFDAPVPVPERPIWGVTAVGPDGSLYVAGRRESTNQSFIVAKSITVQDSTAPLMFDFATEVDMGGAHQFAIGFGPNPGGLQGQVWIAADYSSRERAGYVYMLCSVDPPGSDPLDVHFVRSTDGGLTWSAPLRLNDDAGDNAWQWFGTMSVSPEGRIDVVWLDTREGPGFSSALYYTYSHDGGLSWAQNERLSESFDPHLGWPNQDKLGDYFDMISESKGAHLAWAGTFNGEQDVYYSWIDAPTTGITGDDATLPDRVFLSQNYPNPFNGETVIEYQLPVSAHVTIAIYDILGREVARLVEERMEPGTHRVPWNPDDLAGGIYLYRLQTEDHVISRKLILLK